MNMNQRSVHRQKAVVYLENTRLTFYEPGSRKLIKLEFPQEVVSSAEVIDKKAFQALIQSFITTNAISPAAILLVVAESLLFTKEIMRQDTDTQQPQQIQQQKPQPNNSQPQAPDAPQTENTPLKPVQLTPAELSALQREQEGEARSFIEKVPFENVIYRTTKKENGIVVVATNGDMLENIQQAFFWK